MRITSGRDRQPLSEAKALLPGFLGASRLIGLNNLHQACTRAHREAQLAFEIQDHFEGGTIAQLDICQISTRRKDAHSAGESAEITRRRSILVVCRHVHRMKPSRVRPVPSRYIGEPSIEDREPVVCGSFLVERVGLRVSEESSERGLDSSARMPMQFTITLCGSRRMNFSIGARFKSEVHCRNCGDGNIPRCPIISR